MKKREPKKGEKVLYQGIEHKVESYCLGTVQLRKKFARDFIFVDLDAIEFITELKKKTKLPPTKEKLTQEEVSGLLKRLVKEEFLKDNFKLEITLFYRLFRKYNNREFWLEFTPAFQVKSLLYWINSGGEDLRIFFNKMTLDLSRNSPKIELSEEKIGEDYQIKKKAKNVLDLLG